MPSTASSSAITTTKIRFESTTKPIQREESAMKQAVYQFKKWMESPGAGLALGAIFLVFAVDEAKEGNTESLKDVGDIIWSAIWD